MPSAAEPEMFSNHSLIRNRSDRLDQSTLASIAIQIASSSLPLLTRDRNRDIDIGHSPCNCAHLSSNISSAHFVPFDPAELYCVQDKTRRDETRLDHHAHVNVNLIEHIRVRLRWINCNPSWQSPRLASRSRYIDIKIDIDRLHCLRCSLAWRSRS